MSVQDCIPLFPEEEIPRIINEIVDAAACLKKKSESDREDHLTYRLYGIIIRDKRYRSGPLHYLHPVPQYEVFGLESDGNPPTGRIDLVYVYGSWRDTYFAIEAKRLHVTTGDSGWRSLIGEYVAGNQGVMCFVTGKYSAAQRAGAMLGYVFDGDVDGARSGISKAINDNRVMLMIKGSSGLRRSNVLKRKERVDETQHRFGQRSFTIYHLLVPV
ncbi:MAG: hypothetical protein V2A34_12960 [Lentisphaerota bacterium]